MDLAEVLAALEANVEERRRQLRELEQSRDALRAAIAHGGAQVHPGSEWEQLTRPEAIMRVLAEEGPLGPVGIVDALKARGRTTDTPTRISAAVGKLRQKGRVRSQGRAAWTVVPDPPEPNIVQFPGGTQVT